MSIIKFANFLKFFNTSIHYLKLANQLFDKFNDYIYLSDSGIEQLKLFTKLFDKFIYLINLF